MGPFSFESVGVSLKTSVQIFIILISLFHLKIFVFLKTWFENVCVLNFHVF
jgi:hypothetical protein